jgi:hypothetical protein
MEIRKPTESPMLDSPVCTVLKYTIMQYALRRYDPVISDDPGLFKTTKSTLSLVKLTITLTLHASPSVIPFKTTYVSDVERLAYVISFSYSIGLTTR